MRHKKWKRDGLKNKHPGGPSIYTELNGPDVQTTHTDGSGPTIMFTLNATDDQLLEKLSRVREQWFKVVMARKHRRQRATAWAILSLLILGTTVVCVWLLNTQL